MKAFFAWLWGQGAYALKYYIWQGVALIVVHYVGRWMGRRIQSKLITMEEPQMSDVQSAQGNIGNVGNYSESISNDGHIQASVDIQVDKDLVASIPGAVKATGTIQLKLALDPVAVALFEAGKIDNPVAKFIVGQLQKLRAGEEVHPAVAQAAAEAAKS